MADDGGEPELPARDTIEDLEDQGEAIAARLEDMTVLLLGRGHELDRRRALKTCLDDDMEVGAEILIMEDYPDEDDEDPGEKWDRLVTHKDPGDFIILIPEEGAMSGVGPEYGRIRERFGDATRHHVHFFWPKEVNTREVLDPYMGTMMGRAHAQPYSNEEELCERAYRLLQNLALRDIEGERP